jgi:hypothetical protein
MATTLTSVPTGIGILNECLRRQPALTRFGGALLLLLVPVLAASMIDPRTIDGVSVWAKPAKFLFSIAVHVLTFAWFMGYVRPDQRETPLMRRTVAVLIAANIFELAWIGWQAAHGLRSHFNNDTPFYAVMYALMGAVVLVIVSANVPLAWNIWRRPADGLRPDYRAAVIAGLLLTVALGGGFGIYMSQQTGHAVGAEVGHLPVFSWNRMGGDLRVAHFFGIHAEQAIPLLALSVARLNLPARWVAISAGAAAYAALTVMTFVQALQARPFPF